MSGTTTNNIRREYKRLLERYGLPHIFIEEFITCYWKDLKFLHIRMNKSNNGYWKE